MNTKGVEEKGIDHQCKPWERRYCERAKIVSVDIQIVCDFIGFASLSLELGSLLYRSSAIGVFYD